jgi:hypothetical protein
MRRSHSGVRYSWLLEEAAHAYATRSTPELLA